VAVASHERPVRLRWLLDALEAQTLDRGRFEVVVVHDSRGEETARAVAEHPLRVAGALRDVRVAPSNAARKRNLAWRAARAPLVAFTDDDCRPAPDWLERLLAAAREGNDGVVVQGATRPDPDEEAVLRGSPWARTVSVDPPTPWAETCNVAYPRALLERLGGLDEGLSIGEDTDLAQRALAAGARVVAAPDALVHHAVEAPWLWPAVRTARRWADMAAVVRRHPGLRRELPGRVWLRREHAALALAGAGAAVARRHRLAGAALAAPWVALSMSHRGAGPRGLARSALELPGRATIDAAEVATMAAASVRHRTVLL
jgi:hypothetical protein